jgi:hypothetical protein
VLLGHENLETTMFYTHVARKGVAAVTSPLDLLDDLTAQQIGRRGRRDRTTKRRWDGVCRGYDLFERIQRVFNQRE